MQVSPIHATHSQYNFFRFTPPCHVVKSVIITRVNRVEGGATHRHRRYRRRHNISSKGELPYWQHLGSNVELDRITPVERTEMDDATALADGDLENIASMHRNLSPPRSLAQHWCLTQCCLTDKLTLFTCNLRQ